MMFSVNTMMVMGVLGFLAVGFYALLTCRNLIKIIIALQILAKAALLALVTAGVASNQVNLGQSLGVMVIVVDTVVAVIGLALAIQIRRKTGSLDVKNLASLKG